MELFDGIITLRLVDLIEIGLVGYILYRLYQLMRGTIAVQFFFGIMALLLVTALVTAADMRMLRAFFGLISEVSVLAIIIIFQPEIRRLLLLLGQNPFVRRLVSTPGQEEMMEEVIEAVGEMSRRKIGALLVFERLTGLRNYIETGALLEAQVSRDLLITIFYAQNPLHDGAVIIQNRRIAAARCILPISTSMKLSPQLGLRHRAAVGLTEQSDAFVVVVSEETGRISTARNGELYANLSLDAFRAQFVEALTFQPVKDNDFSPAET